MNDTVHLSPTDIERTVTLSEDGGLTSVLPVSVFDHDLALAYLIVNGVVFINSYHWESEHHPERISVNVNCNDVFAWGCADAEELPYDEIEPLYREWTKSGSWGIVRWCCVRRSERPQGPVESDMRRAGEWDDAMEALPANRTDELVRGHLGGMI